MVLYELYRGKDYKIVPTLDRIQKAVEYVGLKNPPYISVLVGGTNGKGSTCAFSESILRHHGYKTGWFVSPHLFDEKERWRINGQKISEERLKYYVEDLKLVFERFELTYFEACTLIALKFFQDERVDFAVFEVGMGGRWDATRVCNPSACAITNIQRDHIKWLGKTPEERAREKLGIYVPGRPIVLGSPKYPLYPLALEVCQKEDLLVAGMDFFAKGVVNGMQTYLEEFTSDFFHIKDVRLGLWGKWQIDNASIALALTAQVVKLKEDKVRLALENTKLEGRMEVLREKPLLILDGAHNADSVKIVINQLKASGIKLTPVFTGLKEKEWKDSMKILRDFSERIYLLEIRHHRGESLSELVKEAERLNFQEIITLKSAEEVLNLREDILVIGSFYLVGEIKEWIEK
ncbi:bifunctional folylpolyglutamate synthase/dihydrofolate synthase [Thermocrinis jamiesonii]|uniref:bifunctional folylpolyglutamate synthase/dihydrofolate synthase n=1 Tax=Thermocrinis jamiesonii TaxID=1302351 RepID=UPI0004954058|nr:Mur ligase family protein [Thermocrinis jamiesonii]